MPGQKEFSKSPLRWCISMAQVEVTDYRPRKEKGQVQEKVLLSRYLITCGAISTSQETPPDVELPAQPACLLWTHLVWVSHITGRIKEIRSKGANKHKIYKDPTLTHGSAGVKDRPCIAWYVWGSAAHPSSPAPAITNTTGNRYQIHKRLLFSVREANEWIWFKHLMESF